MEITVTKVKVKKNSIFIEYEVLNDKEIVNHFTLSCEEEARAQFYGALDDLLIDVIDICYLDTTSWMEDGRVSGLIIKPEDEGIVITAQCGCDKAKAPIIINTPYFVVDDDKLREKINDVTREAQLYIDGERAQLSLLRRAA